MSPNVELHSLTSIGFQELKLSNIWRATNYPPTHPTLTGIPDEKESQNSLKAICLIFAEREVVFTESKQKVNLVITALTVLTNMAAQAEEPVVNKRMRVTIMQSVSSFVMQFFDVLVFFCGCGKCKYQEKRIIVHKKETLRISQSMLQLKQISFSEERKTVQW